jgi:hypothetical protein
MKVSPANNHGVSKCFETEILSSKTGTEADIELGYLVKTHIEWSGNPSLYQFPNILFVKGSSIPLTLGCLT